MLYDNSDPHSRKDYLWVDLRFLESRMFDLVTCYCPSPLWWLVLPTRLSSSFNLQVILREVSRILPTVSFLRRLYSESYFRITCCSSSWENSAIVSMEKVTVALGVDSLGLAACYYIVSLLYFGVCSSLSAEGRGGIWEVAESVRYGFSYCCCCCCCPPFCYMICVILPWMFTCLILDFNFSMVFIFS